MAGLNQNTGYFAVSDENIIRPFNACADATGAPDSIDDGQRGEHDEQVRRKKRTEQCGRNHILSCDIHPASALPALASGLTVGKYYYSFFWPIMRQLHRQGIGRTDLWQVD